MSFILPIVRLAQQAAPKAPNPINLFKPALPSVSLPRVVSPSLTGMNNYMASFEKKMANNMFELCAVPKKKTSVRRKRTRFQGEWNREAKRMFKPYQICLNCNRAIKPNTVCTANSNCTDFPRI